MSQKSFIVYSGEGQFVIDVSEEFFASFLQNPDYLERFSFFTAGSCRLEGEAREKAEVLIGELNQLKELPLESSADLTKVLLLQLFIVIERSKLHSGIH